MRYKDTFTRGWQRIIGTLGGAGVATLIAALLRPSEAFTAALCVGLAFVFFTLLPVS